jgi:hypothetical protein
VKSALVIFISLLTISCSQHPYESSFGYIEENGKAVAIRVSKAVLPANASRDSLRITLSGLTEPVLGTAEDRDGDLVFTPVVPFSIGYTYDVLYESRIIGNVVINIPGNAPVPKLLSVYPTADTLPENLLKMYFSFSHPMVEGGSLRNISMLRGTDTVRGVFLDLQPELWNEDGTILTLWLDPGRIKRDLIPKREMGNPLEDGGRYTLVVAEGWRSKAGKATTENFTKSFTAGPRDEASPSIAKWRVTAPKSGTQDPVVIYFGETLDRLSAEHSIYIRNQEGEDVFLDYEAGTREESIKLTPHAIWKTGRYTIEVEARLEDPAGNNLTRLFDRDVSIPDSAPPPEGPFQLYFDVF